jgi:hypothetical protein
MGYNGTGWNFLFASITFFFGGLGMFFTRFMKGAWSQVWWNYFPVFWIPIMTSWIPSSCILLGWYDN